MSFCFALDKQGPRPALSLYVKFVKTVDIIIIIQNEPRKNTKMGNSVNSAPRDLVTSFFEIRPSGFAPILARPSQWSQILRQYSIYCPVFGINVHRDVFVQERRGIRRCRRDSCAVRFVLELWSKSNSMISYPTYNQCPDKARSTHRTVSLHTKNGAVVQSRAVIFGGNVQLDPGAVGGPVNNAGTNRLCHG